MVSDLLLQIGAVCIPLGVLISMFAYQFFQGWAKIVFGIFGLIIFLFGAWAFKKVMELAKAELDNKTHEQNDKERERENGNRKFAILINEIRALGKDLTKRGESNDTPKPDKPNDKAKQ